MKNLLQLFCISILFVYCAKSEEKANDNASTSSIQQIKASSYLTEGKTNYLPNNIIDNSSQPWCVNTKDPEPSFEIIFNKSVRAKHIHLLNGYAKGALFKKNSRIAKLILTIDNNEPIELELPDTLEYLKSFEQELTGKNFKFMIKETYKGDNYSDICLTELSFENYDFDGSLNYNAFCSDLFSDFTNINFINDDHYITLTNDNKLTAFRSPAQMDITNEGKGTWRIINEANTKLLDGKYIITLVQNGNDDLTSNEARITTTKIDGEFSIPLETNKECTKLDGSRKIFTYSKEELSKHRYPSKNEILIFK